MKFFWYEIKKITNLNKKEYIWSSRLSSLFDSWLVISSNTFYDLYKSNWDIRQAIRKISNSVSRNWIYLVDNKKKALDNEDLNEEILSYFKSPTFLKWKTELFKNYLLSWELYILPSKNLKWETAGFQIIDSRAVSKQTDGKGKVLASFLANGTIIVK